MKGSKHRQHFKANLIIPVTQNLIWAWVVHLQGRILLTGGFWPLAPHYWRCYSPTMSWAAAEAAWEGETFPSAVKIRENFRRCFSYSSGVWWVTNQFQWSQSGDRRVLAVLWWQPLALRAFLHMLNPELLWLLQHYINCPWLIPAARFGVPRCHNCGRGISAANPAGNAWDNLSQSITVICLHWAGCKAMPGCCSLNSKSVDGPWSHQAAGNCQGCLQAFHKRRTTKKGPVCTFCNTSL